MQLAQTTAIRVRRCLFAFLFPILPIWDLEAQVTVSNLYSFAGASAAAPRFPGQLIRGADGLLYGTVTTGGANNNGAIMRFGSNATEKVTLFSFGPGADLGRAPYQLIYGRDARLYGLATGGTNQAGIIFRIDASGANYAVLRHATNLPSSLIHGSDGRLYFAEAGIAGMDTSGEHYARVSEDSTALVLEGADGLLYATDGLHTIRKVGKDGSATATLLTGFPPDSLGVVQEEISHLAQSSSGFLYGLGKDLSGGTGYFFRVDTNGATLVQARCGAASRPYGPTSFYQSPADGLFYISASGSAGFRGGLTVVDPVIAGVNVGTNLLTWPAITGGEFGALTYDRIVEGAEGSIYGTTDMGGAEFAGLLFRVGRNGSNFTSLVTFSSASFSDGTNAAPPIILGANGFLYGTTRNGGTGNRGTVYRLNPDGSAYSVLKRFETDAEGVDPAAGVVDGGDGYLYGVTLGGGSQGLGVVYKLRFDGSGFSAMYNIRTNRAASTPQDPASCFGALLSDTNGWLYGVGLTGGSAGRGGIFTARKDGGLFTNIHSFVVGEARRPFAGLVEGLDKKLYGVTENGGANDSGIFYRLDKDGGGFQVLRSFGGSEGANPDGALWQDADGTFFGTTSGGGANGFGTIYKVGSSGTGYTVLHHFGTTGDGRRPTCALVLGPSGTLLGTTRFGGTGPSGNQWGTVFEIGKDGKGYSVLRSFTAAGGDGGGLFAGLAPGASGQFYGTCSSGGANGYGSVFSVSFAPNQPPAILSPPISFIGPPGSVTSLTVAAAGQGPLTFQWFFNGSAIALATNNILVVTNDAAGAGAYSVRIIGSGGVTNSGPISLSSFGIEADRTLTLNGASGAVHRIEYASSLPTTESSWTVLTNLSLSADHFRTVDPTPADQRFYRAVVLP